MRFPFSHRHPFLDILRLTGARKARTQAA
ncbi:hypothetical protein NSND_60195 [Nitrospira sp. ND1]|nr:hypothetical protein NSND_60195 [Nitrospira sp. ND1]